MSRNDKWYNTSISFILGIALITFGIIVIVFNKRFYVDTINILLVLVFFNGVKDIIQKILKKKKNVNFYFVFISMIFALVLLFLPKIPQCFFPRFFSAYLLMCSIFNFFMFMILFKNKVNKRYTYLIKFIFLFIVGIIIFFSPLKYVYILLITMGSYFVLLGLKFVINFIYNIIPNRFKNIYKRKIRISLPVWFEAIVPYTVFVDINRVLKVDDDKSKEINTENSKSKFEVLVHVSPNGFNRVGHVDIVYGDKVISYGNYDDSSKKLFNSCGDGILFYTDKEKYIPFCLNHSNKMLFGFEINLNSDQLKHVDKLLDELKSQLVEWVPPMIDSCEDLKKIDYASALYKSSPTIFYKFTKGKFKTYYIFGASCCHFANEIIGHSGIDFLKMNGLITPGSYYDCLNREYVNKTGLVIKRNIYKLDNYNNK